MQLAGKTLSPAALITMVQRPFTWLAGPLVLSMVLVGCSTNTPAPITDIHNSSTPSTATTSGAGQSYTVRPGDTLYKIAQQHGTSVQSIASANGITDPSQLRVGQVLTVGGNGGVVAVAPPRSVNTQPVTTPTEPAPVTDTTPPAATTPTSPVDTSSPRASDADVISWGWPASGTVIQGFTANTKGIDIEGAIGDPVTAAANGKVMYAGNGVRGLGNLILLGHSNGFITAYAHNESLLVKTGQEIKKGQKIATLGQSDTSSPRLHFEVRRRGTPVNPMSYLPSR
ncbi:peptidoglycan DD-metalloendopeptidase family protein [uncultured Paenalcaligenes sp.]|uniref:peptidoglycan DD-metalloendopeptidase family protein n=1 Tax=uncultured Paenalcaligenes sp. TaxID=1588925 RepID=UPI00260D6E40|nr:peptidoglycan DD-metalloendopeptidase family protein [uncultured Paenalcaligenes sp.]